MPIFTYVYKDKSGKIHRGRAEADDERSLTKRLHQSGYWVTQITATGGTANDSFLNDDTTFSEGQPQAQLSDYWQAELQSDGSLRLIQTSKGRRNSTGCLFPCVILYNIAIILGVVAELKLLPLPVENESGIGGLLVGFLLGIFFSYWALWSVYSHEEWHISRNRLDIHRRWCFLRPGKPDCFTNSTLEVESYKSEGGSVSWKLYLCSVGNSIFGKRCLFLALSKYELAALQEMANILSRHTGWQIISPSKFE